MIKVLMLIFLIMLISTNQELALITVIIALVLTK